VSDMIYQKKILVGLDGSPNSATALGWALQAAEPLSSEIEAIYVWQLPALAYSAPGFFPPEEQEIDAEGQRILAAALAANPKAAGTKVTLRVVEGAPAQKLAEAAAEPDVALVVVGASGHGGVSGLLLGSVSHSLTHHCHKPLVIVPKGWLAGDGRIVVGVDGSPGSVRALSWAVNFARFVKSTVDAVLVWPAPPPVMSARLSASGVDAEVALRLAAAVEQIDTTGVQVTQTVIDGQPARRLIARADGADLLVVGTRGLGWAHETISGSVSHSCTHHAITPVAVIPEPR
jgi:nucleotide-binding universal stress UspA family protein